MKSVIVAIKNAIVHFLYRSMIKPLFFLVDPERTHDRNIRFGHFLGKNSATRALTKIAFSYQDKSLKQDVSGLAFRNPVGLAGGFDKNAQIVDILDSVGFGFMEIGSVTGEPCKGNAQPRLWRLKKSKSLLVYYGLTNDGSEAISRKLQGKKFRIPLGVNIARTNTKETCDTESGIQDYVKAYRAFVEIADYFVINISCPNAYGGQPFSDPDRLIQLLQAIDRVRVSTPLFIKLSPDLTDENIDEIISIARKHKITGFICTNLTKNRDNPKIQDSNLSKNGGMSGKVVEDLSNQLIEYIHRKTTGEFVLIGLGGIFTAKDAYKKIRLGANLVQLITGMIFEGPQTIGEINRGLVKLMKKDGFKSIGEAVGADVKPSKKA